MSQDQVRKPRASLGSSEGEDIFGTFDAGVAKRFLGMMVPYRRAFLTAVVAVLVSAASVVAISSWTGLAAGAAGLGRGSAASTAGVNGSAASASEKLSTAGGGSNGSSPAGRSGW